MANSQPRGFSFSVAACVLLLSAAAHFAVGTDVDGFVSFRNTKCDSNKDKHRINPDKIVKTDSAEECFRLCEKKKKCKLAQWSTNGWNYCNLYKKCPELRSDASVDVAVRTTKKVKGSKYYVSPKYQSTLYNDDFELAKIKDMDKLKDCMKECEKTKDCKVAEIYDGDCYLYSKGLSASTTSSSGDKFAKKESATD